MSTSGGRVLIRKLGRVSYAKALSLQKSLATSYKTISPYGLCGEVLVLEHDPVYTFGLRQTEFEAEEVKLRRLGADVVKVRRGGLTTFHGPGQLVCYPILNLNSLCLGVRQYVHCLEQSVISTLAHFDRHGYTTDDTGVWVNNCYQNPTKICAIERYRWLASLGCVFGESIQVSHGVSYHGLALNCSTDLNWFEHIVPCGLEGKGVTSLSELCQRTIEPCQVQNVLIKSLADTIGFRTE